MKLSLMLTYAGTSLKILSTWLLIASTSSWICYVDAESYVQYNETSISLGVYMHELSSPIFYESFIPIIYEYTVPKYSTLDITLRDWRDKCKTENFAPSYTCPVFFHYERFLEKFEAEVVPRAWVKDVPNSNKPSVPKVGKDFCSTIQQHFPGSITQQFGFEEYLEKLQKCPIGEVLITRAIKDYTFNIKQLFKSMNKNYENEFSNSFLGASNSKLSPAFYVNAVTTHQNGMLVAYLLEKERWSQAELSCNSHLIPNSIVKVDNLTNSLIQLKTILKSQKLMGAVNLEETSSFYKIPISDCSYIENSGNFIVRIQIPVTRKGLAPSLYKLESIPFIFDDDKGNGLNRQLCRIRADPRTFIFDKTSGILQTSKCNPMLPLCKLENFASSEIVNPCISSIFTESMEGVKKFCEMDCIPWRDVKDGLKMLPAFHQMKPDTWLVTGHPLTGVAIKCQGKQDKILEHPEIGALEIKLPCSCYLAYHTDSYYPQSSCEDDIDPVVKHILPAHFIKDEKLQMFVSAPADFNKIPEPDYVVSSLVGKSFEGIGAQTSAHVSEGGSNNNGDDSSSGSGAFIWVVFVIQLIIFVILAAVATFKYVDRRRKLNAFSKERLVYNVYPSASNPNLSSSTSSDTYPYTSQRSSITENNLNIM